VYEIDLTGEGPIRSLVLAVTEKQRRERKPMSPTAFWFLRWNDERVVSYHFT